MTIKARSRKRIGCSKIGFKREVYSNTIIPQETRKTQNMLYWYFVTFQRKMHFKQSLHAQFLQSYLTLCDPMDYSPPGSSVHGILQLRILKWVAISHCLSTQKCVLMDTCMTIYVCIQTVCVYIYTHKNVSSFWITRHSVFIFSLNIIVL